MSNDKTDPKDMEVEDVERKKIKYKKKLFSKLLI